MEAAVPPSGSGANNKYVGWFNFLKKFFAAIRKGFPDADLGTIEADVDRAYRTNPEFVVTMYVQFAGRYERYLDEEDVQFFLDEDKWRAIPLVGKIDVAKHINDQTPQQNIGITFRYLKQLLKNGRKLLGVTAEDRSTTATATDTDSSTPLLNRLKNYAETSARKFGVTQDNMQSEAVLDMAIDVLQTMKADRFNILDEKNVDQLIQEMGLPPNLVKTLLPQIMGGSAGGTGPNPFGAAADQNPADMVSSLMSNPAVLQAALGGGFGRGRGGGGGPASRRR